MGIPPMSVQGKGVSWKLTWAAGFPGNSPGVQRPKALGWGLRSSVLVPQSWIGHDLEKPRPQPGHSREGSSSAVSGSQAWNPDLGLQALGGHLLSPEALRLL